MTAVDIILKTTEKVQIDGDYYILNTNKKSLFKFFHKIKDSTPEAYKLMLVTFVDSKMKMKKNEIYTEENRHRDIRAIANSLNNYFQEFVMEWCEEEVEDHIETQKTYIIKEENNEEDKVEEEDKDELL